VRLDIGIEPGAQTIDVQLPDQTVLGEQIKRVVNGGLRNVATQALKGFGNLLRRQMLRRSKKHFSNPQALLSGPDAAGLKAPGDFRSRNPGRSSGVRHGLIIAIRPGRTSPARQNREPGLRGALRP